MGLPMAHTLTNLRCKLSPLDGLNIPARVFWRNKNSRGYTFACVDVHSLDFFSFYHMPLLSLIQLLKKLWKPDFTLFHDVIALLILAGKFVWGY